MLLHITEAAGQDAEGHLTSALSECGNRHRVKGFYDIRSVVALELCEELSFREQAEELVMLRLRTARGLPLDEYRRFTGRDFAADNAALIAGLCAEGLARMDEGPEGPRFALTRPGMLISNAVIEQCFETIPDSPAA